MLLLFDLYLFYLTLFSFIIFRQKEYDEKVQKWKEDESVRKANKWKGYENSVKTGKQAKRKTHFESDSSFSVSAGYEDDSGTSEHYTTKKTKTEDFLV